MGKYDSMSDAELGKIARAQALKNKRYWVTTQLIIEMARAKGIKPSEAQIDERLNKMAGPPVK